ncbi:MAG: protein translocase subunit SecD [Pseudomonadales bacterium]
MLNKYPLWKYLLILLVIVFGVVYASPNLYAPDPAVQITSDSSGTAMSEADLERATTALSDAGVAVSRHELTDANILLRLEQSDDQLAAQAALQRVMGDDYVVALNLAPTTPQWLESLGGQPMKLGLDLQGGVHFLMEVDTQAAIETRIKTNFTEIKRALRKARVISRSQILDDGRIELVFKTEELRGKARDVLASDFASITRTNSEKDDKFITHLSLTEEGRREIETYAVSQNLTTLRNRVNELGVAEPLVARQGTNRIVVELPGVQDTARAKKILGKAANLEFRLEAEIDASMASKEEFEFRSPRDQGRQAYLERDIIITGERVSGAQASFDENSQPQVNISLDSVGGQLMNRTTSKAIKRRMGVLFIERKTNTIRDPKTGDEIRKESYDEKKIISLATIQTALPRQFRITGLDNIQESSELALLLRAGALAAPIEFVEERTVGPSLGAENISLGMKSVQIGMGLVLIFMLIYYRVFGIAANLALALNLVLLIAVMSLLSATLTLPGIAGIVLTVGMAVDANVLIFARIREELKNGLSPQAAINSGYERAFVTIMDANLTTLLVAVILYAVGTGSVKGFAVTLSIGICTSMFTAIVGTRALINLIYGGRRVKSLSI